MVDDEETELLQRLRALAVALDGEKRDRWDRSLPLADLICDRWERASRLGFGDETSIYDSSVVLGDVRVGANTWIGPSTILDGSGGRLVIGSWCTVSAATHIYTHDTVLHSLSGGRLPQRTAAVTIADRVYIGPGCIVTAGAAIGRMSVVAANSLVRSDVPERSIVGGTPARPIGEVCGEDDDLHLVMHPQG